MKRTLTLIAILLAVVLGGVIGPLRAGDITPQAIAPYDLYNFLEDVVSMSNTGKSETNKNRKQVLDRTLDSAGCASNGTTLQVEDFSYTVDGIIYNKASAAVTVTAAVQATSTYNVYLFSINSAGTASCTKGTAHATLSSVAWPATPASYTPFGFLQLKAGNVTAFTLGTTPFGVASETKFFNLSIIASPSSSDALDEVGVTDLSLTGL